MVKYSYRACRQKTRENKSQGRGKGGTIRSHQWKTKNRQNAVNIYQWWKTRELCHWWLVNMSLEANTRKNRSLISCWPNVNSVVTLVIAGEFTSLVENAGNMMTTRGKRFRRKNDCVLCTKKTNSCDGDQFIASMEG